ncbi:MULTISPECIES: SLATT domain-containing protein [Pseudomonas]|uniref:SLATT domain-containing protein n=1 Tax=Pseudomonas TaxID=286 RepID=UPI0006D3FD34|nr:MULTISPECIES: SLATT domain-containing protein [Pseudomonas]PNB53819.1 hypothetical protein C1X73_29585 [Pseudomonas sp. FW305-130]MBP2081783.1 hypothetical protein [Pseudomonas sp. PvP089]MBP2086600.1 hypothetical protein [Pseudomonas sp. PvP088]MBP2221239.1 hypothetical protein [Pseudomonas putida]PNA86532.1 hypothetical protein C1X74_29900 [Pseudomonas sp. GW460-5]
MDQQVALKLIAEKAYDVGYSAKLHFSTYDIVENAPGRIGLISLVIGVLALYIDFLAAKHVSALITVIGICSLYITYYADTKEQYFQAGNKLTQLLDQLRVMSARCKSSQQFTATDQAELDRITADFGAACLRKHILFSGWLAHKKFFWDHQIDWIAEHREFRFFRDKIPFSVYALIVVVLIALAGGSWLATHPELLLSLKEACTHE